jgi:hypothetical protein
MTDRAKELEAAAKDIAPASLQAAKAAIVASCAEYVRWADLFSCRLETVPAAGVSPCSATCPPGPAPVLSASSTTGIEPVPAAAMQPRTAVAMPTIPRSAYSSRPSRSWAEASTRIRASFAAHPMMPGCISIYPSRSPATWPCDCKRIFLQPEQSGLWS